METLLEVAHREFLHVTETQESTEQASHLVTLLCSLQTSLAAWCYMQITGTDETCSTVAQDILVKCKPTFFLSILLLAFEIGISDVELAALKSSNALEDFLKLEQKTKVRKLT